MGTVFFNRATSQKFDSLGRRNIYQPIGGGGSLLNCKTILCPAYFDPSEFSRAWIRHVSICLDISILLLYQCGMQE